MPVIFRKVLIADERYESADVYDVNGDGVLDIVSGGFWYEGPDFRQQHRIGDVMVSGEYYDDFATIPLDVNGDGRIDFVSGGWFGKTLRWHENPEDPTQQWPQHDIVECGSIETARGWDVDGDGQIEVVPNVPGGPLAFYKLVVDENGRGTGEFSEHTVYPERQGHGLGFGDIDGDGRGDLVLATGWLEPPDDPLAGEWTFHPEFDVGHASIPIIVADVNRDGLSDLIVGEAHGYGLHWWEQSRRDGGERTWTQHAIDLENSQYHDMQWVDIDGDGECELVTGKRYRAHSGNDPGSTDPVGIYYFKWDGHSFVKQVIDWGPLRVGTGCGIYFAVADLTGSGRLDIVAPGKDGLYVFFNEG